MPVEGVVEAVVEEKEVRMPEPVMSSHIRAVSDEDIVVIVTNQPSGQCS